MEIHFPEFFRYFSGYLLRRFILRLCRMLDHSEEISDFFSQLGITEFVLHHLLTDLRRHFLCVHDLLIGFLAGHDTCVLCPQIFQLSDRFFGDPLSRAYQKYLSAFIIQIVGKYHAIPQVPDRNLF